MLHNTTFRIRNPLLHF